MKVTIEQLKNEILAFLCSADEMEAAVNKVLEMIGDYFSVDRAYVFENTADDRACMNTFEWCNAGITPEIENLQYLDYETDLGFDWMDNYNADGLFFCPDILKLPPKQRAVLEPQGIYSMLHCAIRERGEFKGYIGFDNCKNHSIGWEHDQDAVDTLVFVSRLLSLYLLEYRNKSRLMEMVKAEEEKKTNLQVALDEAVRSNQVIKRVATTDFDYIMVVNCGSDTYRLFVNDRDSSMSSVVNEGCYSEMIRAYAQKYVLPEDRHIAVEEMEVDYIKAELLKKGVYTTQARLKEPDGIEHIKQAKFAFLDDSQTNILITRVDVTELVQSAEREKNLLSRALDEARNANLAKTEFLARMSHDIRTPMNAIIGLTALSLDEKDLPQQLRENLMNIRGSSDFLLGLVNDILDMSKIEAGAVTLKLEPYYYTDFLAKMKAMFEPQCKAKNITFEFEDVTLSTAIFTDKLRLDQIFFNIFSNAVKFTPEGGKISYYTENIVTDGKKLACDYIIQDTGIGMSKAFLNHIFEPFLQEDNQYSSNLKGSGLGLPIAKSLIELMGGTISVESEVNVGTKIRVHLGFALSKMEERHQFAQKLQVPDGMTVLQGKRILLVEDHPLNAQIAAKLLEKEGMTVVHAVNGKAGVDNFVTSPPSYFNAVLMDIRMPVMDGLEATRAIRSSGHPDAKTIPIIAMSANAYDEDVKKSIDAGMDDHLAKPVEPKKLYSTLKMFLAVKKN